MASVSVTSTRIAAPPATSGIVDRSLVSTGVWQAIASSGGMPNPS